MSFYLCSIKTYSIDERGKLNMNDYRKFICNFEKAEL